MGSFAAVTPLLPIALAVMQQASWPHPEDVPTPAVGEVGLAGGVPPDIARFLQVRAASAPSLSPDGKRVAFRTSITGSPQVWVVDAGGGWPEQLTFGEAATEHAWSPSGEWILYASDRAGNEREGFYLVSPDGKRERELLAPSAAFRVFGGFSPDGRRIAYATTERNGVDFDIHVLDVASGRDEEVLRGRMGLYVASWRPDGGALLLVESRGEDANDLHLLDLKTRKLETLRHPDVPALYESFAWKPDSSGFYLATDEGREFAGLAWFDVTKRELAWIETPERDVESVVISRDGKHVVWTENDAGSSRLRYWALDDPRPGIPRTPELPPGVYGVTWAEGASVLAIRVTGPRVPGDVWTWDPASGATRRATGSSTAGLDLDACVLPEAVSFAARDGETIRGLLYLPGRTSGAKPPVVLDCHGGPTSQARPTFNPVQQYLLARGLAILDLNYRGSTGFGKRYARLDNGRLRPNGVRDMEDAIHWLAKDGRADAKRAAVMGGSYGGFLAYAGVTRFPELFRGAVSFVGVSNWVTALAGASPQLKASDRVEYGNVDDPKDREFFVELSPITHVKDVKAPILVVHGANDPRDPVTESDQFVSAVRANGGTVEYLRFADEGHGLRKLPNRITAYRRIAAFLERVLAERAG